MRITAFFAAMIVVGTFAVAARSGDPPATGPATRPATAPARPLRVAFTHSRGESDWRLEFIKSVVDEAAARKVELLDSGTDDPAEQLKFIRASIVRDVDVIVISPIIDSGFSSALRDAKEFHIPVIVMDRPLELEDPSVVTTTIRSDYTLEGKMAAQWMIAKLKDGGDVLELRGTVGSMPALDRSEGFNHEIQKTKFTLVADAAADFTRKTAENKTHDLLAAGKLDKLKVVFAHNDDMALGAITALEAAGKKPGENVLIIGVDATVDALKAVKAGKMNATVQCTPFVGPILFDTIEAIAAGKKVPAEIIHKEIVIDATNVDAELKKWGQ